MSNGMSSSSNKVNETHKGKKINLYLQGACTLCGLSPKSAKKTVRFLQRCKQVCGWEDCVLISIS